MKIALYARVSKSEEGLQDPDNQLIPMRNFCKAMGWDIIKEYVDRCSGGDSNRPDFQRMLGKIRQRHFDLVLIWSLDRFSREGIVNTISYIKQLKKYKTGLRSMQESWLDTSEGGVSELLLAVMSWVAEQERKRISQRTKAALTKLKNKGKKLGPPIRIKNYDEILEVFKENNNVSKTARQLGISYTHCWKIVKGKIKLT